jgi:hypothetical protein
MVMNQLKILEAKLKWKNMLIFRELSWNWESFDGSSTRQAEGGSSDCLLVPVAIILIQRVLTDT